MTFAIYLGGAALTSVASLIGFHLRGRVDAADLASALLLGLCWPLVVVFAAAIGLARLVAR